MNSSFFVFFLTDWHIEQRESCRIESVKNKQAQASSFQDKSHMEELAGTEGIKTKPQKLRKKQ